MESHPKKVVKNIVSNVQFYDKPRRHELIRSVHINLSKLDDMAADCSDP